MRKLFFKKVYECDIPREKRDPRFVSERCQVGIILEGNEKSDDTTDFCPEIELGPGEYYKILPGYYISMFDENLLEDLKIYPE